MRTDDPSCAQRSICERELHVNAPVVAVCGSPRFSRVFYRRCRARLYKSAHLSARVITVPLSTLGSLSLSRGCACVTNFLIFFFSQIVKCLPKNFLKNTLKNDNFNKQNYFNPLPSPPPPPTVE